MVEDVSGGRHMAPPTVQVKVHPPQVDSINESRMVSFYSNIARVAGSNEEFFLDFGVRDPNNPSRADMTVRLAMTTYHAKRLATLLDDTLRNYEQAFGTIVSPMPKIPPVTDAKS
jgi:hypothetical protein